MTQLASPACTCCGPRTDAHTSRGPLSPVRCCTSCICRHCCRSGCRFFAFVVAFAGDQTQQAVGVDEIFTGKQEGVAVTELLIRTGRGRVRAK